jgi:hypothetical protein
MIFFRKKKNLAQRLLLAFLKFLNVLTIIDPEATASELRWHMNKIRILEKSNNLEIISKIMNSVAKQCDCRIRYDAETGSIQFHGDRAYRKYIAEETLSFFGTA